MLDFGRNWRSVRITPYVAPITADDIMRRAAAMQREAALNIGVIHGDWHDAIIKELLRIGRKISS